MISENDNQRAVVHRSFTLPKERWHVAIVCLIAEAKAFNSVLRLPSSASSTRLSLLACIREASGFRGRVLEPKKRR
jgi:hypothetical protein